MISDAHICLGVLTQWGFNITTVNRQDMARGARAQSQFQKCFCDVMGLNFFFKQISLHVFLYREASSFSAICNNIFIQDTRANAISIDPIKAGSAAEKPTKPILTSAWWQLKLFIFPRNVNNSKASYGQSESKQVKEIRVNP